jgi:hypothetical protein
MSTILRQDNRLTEACEKGLHPHCTGTYYIGHIHVACYCRCHSQKSVVPAQAADSGSSAIEGPRASAPATGPGLSRMDDGDSRAGCDTPERTPPDLVESQMLARRRYHNGQQFRVIKDVQFGFRIIKAGEIGKIDSVFFGHGYDLITLIFPWQHIQTFHEHDLEEVLDA